MLESKEAVLSIATLTSKGQATIPKEVRERLGLRPGDRMELILEGDSVVLRTLTRDIRELKGMLPKPGKAVTLAQMEQAIRARAARR